MSTWSNARARATAVVVAGIGSALLLSACQVGLNDSDAQKATDNATGLNAPDTGGAPKPTKRPDALAPNGTARLDGSTQGSLTASAVADYNAGGSAAEISIGNSGAQRAFQRLCTGGIDMVDSARSISARELEVCQEHGLQVVQLQVASDAVVVAIKSETDVGGDCLTMGQVDDIYRAGSPVTNWRDVGYANVPIRVGGPDRSSNAFDFFGRSVLGAPEPSMTYLRSDYLAYPDDAMARIFVVGFPLARERAKLAAHYEQLSASRRTALTAANTTLASAKVTAANALRERRKGIVDGRSAADQRRDAARLTAARQSVAAAQAEVNRQRSLLADLAVPLKQTTEARKAIDGLRGRVAYFRYTYYELFEDDLRPFEISTDGTKNCVFPSESTITSGAYPLSRRLLVTTTTRSLERNEVEDFLTTYLTGARQDAISARLLPIPEAVVTQQLAWLRGTEPPRVLTPGDLSSVEPEPEQAQ